MDKLQLLQQFSMTVEDIQAKGINFEEISIEELQAKLEEFSTQAQADVDAPADNADADDNQDDSNFSADDNQDDANDDDADQDDNHQEFALTGEQFRNELSRALSTEKYFDSFWEAEVSKYWYVDVKSEESVVVAFNNQDYNIYGISYATEGDKFNVDFASAKRFKVDYVPMELDGGVQFSLADVVKDIFSKEAIEAKIEQAVSVKTADADKELAELRQFKAEKLKAEREAGETELFDKFTGQLTDEELQTVRDSASELSLEQIEVQLFALVGKKTAKFTTAKPKTSATKVNVPLSTEGKDGQPTWAYLVEKAKK